MTAETPHTQFALTDEQRAIQELAVSFGEERLAPDALTWDQNKIFPVDVIRSGAPLGLGGICVRDDVGGSGLTRLAGVLIYEGMARACPSVTGYFTVHNMVALLIDRFGTQAQRERWLPAMCRFDLFGAYCLTEPGTGSDASMLTTRAEREGDTYVLHGVKQFISGAGAADVYIVMARTGGTGARGISAFVVEKDAPGLSFGPPEKKMGWNAQPTRQVVLQEVRVPADQRLGDEGAGFGIAMNALDGGRLNIAACSLGGARSAFTKAVAYLAERQAFGRRLADMQALQFRVADMATSLETAEILLWRAAAALDAGDPRATTLCAMAKRFVTDTGFAVANDALQLLGGYGYLQDYGIEKLVRDLRVHQILEGTNEIMRVIIARQFTPKADAHGGAAV